MSGGVEGRGAKSPLPHPISSLATLFWTVAESRPYLLINSWTQVGMPVLQWRTPSYRSAKLCGKGTVRRHWSNLNSVNKVNRVSRVKILPTAHCPLSTGSAHRASALSYSQSRAVSELRSFYEKTESSTVFSGLDYS